MIAVNVPARFTLQIYIPLMIVAISCQDTKPAFFQMQPPVAEPGTGLRASDCGACHQSQYQDWKHSTHAAAYTDLQFQSEIAKPGAPVEICKNCHIPLGNQREVLFDGSVNPLFDRKLQLEGVTCAVCHVRTDSGRSVIVGSGSPSDSLAMQKAAHPVVIDRAYLHSRCESCHQANFRLTDHYVCSFNTAVELKSGPFGKTHTCASCHLEQSMQPVQERKAGSQNLREADSRMFRRHLFPGGGVPKSFELFPYLLTVQHDTALDFETGQIVFNRDGKDSLQIPVTIRNSRAGHYVPTGDPERFILVRVRLLDERNVEWKRQEYRIGQLWQWEPAKKVFDNRLAPQESRLHVFHFEGTSPVRSIALEAYHIRLSEENARYIKATAGLADPAFRTRIAEIDRHYPFAALIWSKRLDLLNGQVVEKDRNERNRESAQLRGYPK
jgi:hypothetical protein